MGHFWTAVVTERVRWNRRLNAHFYMHNQWRDFKIRAKQEKVTFVSKHYWTQQLGLASRTAKRFTWWPAWRKARISLSDTFKFYHLTCMSSLQTKTIISDYVYLLNTSHGYIKYNLFYFKFWYYRPAQILSSTAASPGTGGGPTSGVTTAWLTAISTGLQWHSDPIKNKVLKWQLLDANFLGDSLPTC